MFAHGHSRNYASRRTGNSGWSAPELLDNADGLSRRPTPESDVYAFGIVCIEVGDNLHAWRLVSSFTRGQIYLGRAPYMDDDGSMAFYRRVLEGARPERPEVPVRHDELPTGERMRDELWNLATQCWNKRKEVRPTALEAFRRLYRPVPRPVHVLSSEADLD